VNWRKSSYSGGGGQNCVEMAAMPWRKSSYSGGTGSNCVEVAGLKGRMAVRDSKDKTGPALAFDLGDWSAFVTGIRSGGLAS
jgi:Domain of unknown function (DUF397)